MTEIFHNKPLPIAPKTFKGDNGIPLEIQMHAEVLRTGILARKAGEVLEERGNKKPK